MLLENVLDNHLAKTGAQGLLRSRFVITERFGNEVVVDGQRMLCFSSNDYLGLANHPLVKKAFVQGVEQYGLGSGASALVSGYYKSQQLLEDAFAEFLQRPRAILFCSGFHANLGVMTTLAKRHTHIFSDKLCHASLLDGIQLSRAKHTRFPHQDFTILENALLKSLAPQKLVVTESLFSMLGDVTRIDKLARLADEHDATLIVDDAHGIGVLGAHGRGVVEHFNLNTNDIPCLVTPLGKALGSVGAIVSGNADMIEALVQFARTYRYTTALPPATAVATLAALKLLQTENWRREKLQSLIQFFITEAKARHLPLLSDELTPINAILIGNNQKALRLQSILFANHFYLSCIRPPTVPVNTARIRISLNCLHNEADIVRLLDLLAEHL